MNLSLFTLPDGSIPRFTCTNESLEAIMAGLEPKQGDVILAIGGSGDQAFAMLESGARVVVVDFEPEQIVLIERRRDALAAGDYWAFAQRAHIGTDHQYELELRLIERDDYFKDSERLARMRANVGNLMVLPPVDIFDVIRGNAHAVSFGKLYLSSALGFLSGHEPTFPPDAMHLLSRHLSPGTRVYLAKASVFSSFCSAAHDHHQYPEDCDIDWMPKDLPVNHGLTAKARMLEHRYAFQEFSPAVYEKVA